jgi:maleylpyruvate isomerase
MIDIDIPTRIDAVDKATRKLLETAEGTDDAALHAPSILPGWNRAMLLTHLARNADGIAGMLAGARRGEVVHLYPHGREGRNTDIEAGRERDAVYVVTDVRAASARLAEACSAMSPTDWEREGQAFASSAGDRRFAVWHMLVTRRREVEVHHVDLGLGYVARDWPVDFVITEIDALVADLPRRLSPGDAVRLVATDGLGEWRGGAADAQDQLVEARGGDLLAWLLGRPADVPNAPNIAPWQ